MKDEAGFTLVEALVALVVLAFAGVALLGATETHVRRIADLEDRAIAQWVAENRMAELSIDRRPPQNGTHSVTMLGTRWSVNQSVRPTNDPDLADVELTVTASGKPAVLSRYTGFIDTGAGR